MHKEMYWQTSTGCSCNRPKCLRLLCVSPAFYFQLFVHPVPANDSVDRRLMWRSHRYRAPSYSKTNKNLLGRLKKARKQFFFLKYRPKWTRKQSLIEKLCLVFTVSNECVCVSEWDRKGYIHVFHFGRKMKDRNENRIQENGVQKSYLVTEVQSMVLYW